MKRDKRLPREYSEGKAICPRCRNYDYLVRIRAYPDYDHRRKVVNGMHEFCPACILILEDIVTSLSLKQSRDGKVPTPQEYANVAYDFINP